MRQIVRRADSSAGAKEAASLTDAITSGQVRPVGIVGLDQGELVGAAAGLDLLFPRNGLVHAVLGLKPGEKPAAVSLGESVNRAGAMSERASRKVGGHSDMERSVTLARRDVDAWSLHRPLPLAYYRHRERQRRDPD